MEQEEKRLRISAAAGTSVLTPFAQLLAEKTVYERQPSTPTSSVNQVGLEGYKVLRDVRINKVLSPSLIGFQSFPLCLLDNGPISSHNAVINLFLQ